MPPHKKQRIDAGKSDADLLTLVSLPTTKAAIEAASEALLSWTSHWTSNLRQICNYLDLDLLNLGRTSKNFRAFLLDKANERKLWVPALANTPGIPVRPPFMSEPAFAHLLYSPHCHNYGKSKVRDITYSCFNRLCPGCFSYKTMRPDFAACDATTIDSSGTLSRVVFDNGNRELYRFRDDFVDRVFKEFAALPTPVTLEAVSALAEKARAAHRDTLPYAHDLHLWVEDQEEQRLARIEAIRKRRYEAILSRLREAGWKKELSLMDARKLEALSNFPVVRQASKLTNRGEPWPKVKIALDEYMKRVQDRRLDWKYRALLKTRFGILEKALVAHYVTLPRTARMDYRPQYIDFAFTPECRAIVDVPASEPVTVEQFAAVIPALAQKWDADCRKALTDYLLPHLGDIPADVDPLELAISFFSCGSSTLLRELGELRYPTVIKHRCFRGDCFRHARNYTIGTFFEDDVYTRTVKSLDWTEFDLKQQLQSKPDNELQINSPWQVRATGDRDKARTVLVVDIMRRIVSASGLDPARALLEDLEQSDVWLRCVTCETQHPHNEILAMSWKGAFRHERDHVMQWHVNARAIPEWRQADGEDMIKVRAFKEAESRDAKFGDGKWACSLCTTFNATAKAMGKHLEQTHSIPDIYQARRDGVIYLWLPDRYSVYADSVSLRKRIEPEAAWAHIETCGR
ncbi:uncharacterized protein TRAVEDRAFT_47178 [Trametes versicolor FP-101664 SS1]|uniref:uncharacterized protein n=1 Tax=Trametes versicolor (strain FP-101664) TaxID=717944 RepID=UPI0004621B92|nr:uncharacterized protein TRAVEDRAFT_47178 [Trametes versicolor FP-101664 SS1]EIW59876.1 hypothetical protein TRAVEDRAFT_47178 [Trametes versicolor FP-101664 SS1]